MRLKKSIVSRVKQLNDKRQVVATVPVAEAFAATQKRVKTATIS